ncbi:MAG: glutathione peroxidase [Pseudomonadales bacterium]|jgi:glutathione peroxidase|nr:glutathione peroxidase [Pseudomonadales bacterium]MCP5321466.1 glutathione peroxidase [Pseudomonadales bacterium]MCP5336375.1 glutathione peroxidase [Pseudomonadales bacterium]
MTSIHDFSCRTTTGETRSLADYRGKVLLIVNTASKCGFTPQFEGLERLHEKYTARGLAVLGFPCNQFAAQDPGSDAEILSFCQTRYDVKFQMFAKVEVNGDAADPLYRFLKKEAPGVLGTAAIKWNFTKFLVDRDGKVLARFAPKDAPESIEDRIVALL